MPSHSGADPMDPSIHELTIGRLADLAGVPVSTIRYYEKRNLIAPKARSRGDYRVFDGESLRRLQLILTAKQAGFTLGEIRSLLSLDANSHCEEVAPLVESKFADLRQRMEELKNQESRLITLSKLCEGLNGDCCRFISGMVDSPTQPSRRR